MLVPLWGLGNGGIKLPPRTRALIWTETPEVPRGVHGQDRREDEVIAPGSTISDLSDPEPISGLTQVQTLGSTAMVPPVLVETGIFHLGLDSKWLYQGCYCLLGLLREV